ncbi:hypothetical protein BCR24_14765 [Enterococcus ureilyticus]|uniref:Uncharacterized protein n=1 Tax=Enterococcus ureilyticus TaxID=1131292 RepID=A0A1E5HD71_9ENTE|nr:hypothetical protein BCR24_14765 [Enterococcus ureilyticus]
MIYLYRQIILGVIVQYELYKQLCKKIVKKTIFLSTTLVVFMAVGLVFIFIVKGFKMPHVTVEDIVIILILGFSLPIIILGIVIGLPLL